MVYNHINQFRLLKSKSCYREIKFIMEKKLIEGIFFKCSMLTILLSAITASALALGLFHMLFRCPAAPLFNAAALFAVITLVCHLLTGSRKIIVTDINVHCYFPFGRKVLIPLDMVCAVAYGPLGTLSICTPSGKITFRLLLNHREVFDTVKGQLLRRQHIKSP